MSAPPPDGFPPDGIPPVDVPPQPAAAAGQAWDARLYADRHAFVWQHGASLVEQLAPQPGEKILDLGCGTGRLTAEIAAAGADVLGLDASPAMIDEARSQVGERPGLRFTTADARTFAEPPPSAGPSPSAGTIAPAGSFDAVFSNAALHWVRPPEAVVRNVRRVLRPGGRFLAEFGGHGNVARITAVLRRVLSEFVAGDLLPAWYFPTLGQYASLLEREGLEPTTAALFDRPTPLEGSHGLRDWVTMFAADATAAVPAAQREAFFRRVEEEARPALWDGGRWVADYRRLRITARVPAGGSTPA